MLTTFLLKIGDWEFWGFITKNVYLEISVVLGENMVFSLSFFYRGYWLFLRQRNFKLCKNDGTQVLRDDVMIVVISLYGYTWCIS